MRILFYRWKVYHQQAIRDAFEKIGCEVIEEIYKSDNYNNSDIVRESVKEKIISQDADVVFSVNYFGNISNACEEVNVPYVCWTCDSPLISMYNKSVYNKCNFLFIFDMVQFYYFKGLGLENVFYLPLGCEDRKEDDLKGDEFASEISFVGSMYEKNSYDDIIDKLSPYLRGYFDAAMNAQADIFGENIFDRLLTPDILARLIDVIDFKQDKDSISDISMVFNTTFLGFKMAQKERIGCLSALGQNHEVKLYTDTDIFINGVKNMGSVDYHSDMAKVFYQSKVNLNLTIRNIRSGIPLRAWDVLGSKGFLLTNFQAEYLQYFDNERELVWFDSIADMCKKADYYLEHEEKRQEIAICGYENAIKNHSYEKRVKYMLDLLKQTL